MEKASTAPAAVDLKVLAKRNSLDALVPKMQTRRPSLPPILAEESNALGL
jgi:hypothetical protein